MSKPLSTESMLYEIIEHQLVEAINADHGNLIGKLGPKGSAVLCEILGAVTDTPDYSTVDHVDRAIERLLTHRTSTWPEADRSLLQSWFDEVARLRAVIETPENDDFIVGVSIEAEYQCRKHGVDNGLAARNWTQWLWVAGYLLNKAVAACQRDDTEKGKHHLVTTAALLKNWHNVLIGQPAASVHSNSGQPAADTLAGN